MYHVISLRYESFTVLLHDKIPIKDMDHYICQLDEVLDQYTTESVQIRAFWNHRTSKFCQGSRNIRKSAKVVTMSLEGSPPPRQLVTALGCKADPPL